MTDDWVEELGEPTVRYAEGLIDICAVAAQARSVALDTVLQVLAAQRHGSTRIPVPAPFAELDPAQLGGLVGRHDEAYQPLLSLDGWLYQQRALHYERSVASRIGPRLRQDAVAPQGLDEAEATVAATGVLSLSAAQRRAVRQAVTRPLTVITGGPGTGKTTIVVSVLRVLARLGIAPAKIALAAPTGKAAHRLGESIAAQLQALAEPDAADDNLRTQLADPMTLHRLLRYSVARGVFLRGEADPLTQSWVIVDEASMIDLMVMERLVRALPADAKLVLLGDAEQLPSVDAGAVLRDIIGDGGPHVVRLARSFRVDEQSDEGSAILALADAVRSGDPIEVDELAQKTAAVRFMDVDPAHMQPALLAFMDDWFDERVAANPSFFDDAKRTYVLDAGRFNERDQDRITALFAGLERSRVLCLTRVLPTGAEALNASFHLRHARHTRSDTIPDYIAGEPVMVLRNDYRRQLFNGDQGILLWIESDQVRRLCAVFPTADGFVAHQLSALAGRVTHAWAMTVHKSQGSEFDDIAIVLPREDLPMLLSRELLYTAITRARRSVTVFGPASLFRQGAARKLQRWSGLAERLR